MLEVKVYYQDIKYFSNNSFLYIDGQKYIYQIFDRSELYIDDNYHNYIFLTLYVIGLANEDNYIYEILLPKEYKALAKYFKDYL